MIPLLPALLALIAGIVCSAHLDAKAVWLCLPLTVILSLARKRCALIAVFLLGGGLRSLEHPAPALPAGSEASRVAGTLLQRPDWRGLGVYLDFAIESIDGRPYQGHARLTEFLDEPEQLRLFKELELGSGDFLEILVRLRLPATYRDPGVFDFRRYLEQQGVFWTGTIRNPRLITVVRRAPSFRRAGDRIRSLIEDRLSRPFLGDADAQGLVLGMVLGRKHDLTPEVERDFRASGLYHMVVVSGFNLAVIAGAAHLLTRYLFARRMVRLIAVAFAVLGYCVLVGGQPPVLRAALTACILIAGKLLDRDYSPLNAIALAAAILLGTNPRALEDASFQMTFAAAAAVAGIGIPAARWALEDLHHKLHRFDDVELDGFLAPEVADWRVARRMFCELHRLPHAVVTVPWRLYQLTMEGLIVSLAVEMIFLVFMVESFHRLSPLSPFLNLPAGLIAAAVTTLGLLLIVAPSLLAGPVSWLMATLVHVLLAILEVGLSLPHATLRVPSVPGWLWSIYAFSVALTIVGIRLKKPWSYGLGAIFVVALQYWIVTGDFSPMPPSAVTATFLDVGQGDSALIEFPDGRLVLIDGGGVSAGRFLGLHDESTFSIGEDVVSAYLFSRGIRRLDTVVLTHAHHDHMDGLFDILRNFNVGELWVGRNPMIPPYRALIDLAQKRGIPLRFLFAGQQIREFEVLHPPPKWRPKKTAENNDSVVLLLRVGRQSALFTGDLELPLPGVPFVNLLKVAHHGSKGVRMRVKSDVRVISVGASNPFGHPHASALPALRTDLLGAIEVQLGGDRLIVHTR